MVFTAIAIGLAIGGMALQAYEQHKAGEAAKAVANAQAASSESEASLADYNSGVAAAQAKDAIDRGVIAEGKFRDQVKGVIGQQRAGIAGNNIDVGFGSAVDVQADAARLGELDSLTIRNNAAREAWGYNVTAYDLSQRAKIDRQTGANQRTAGDVAQSAGNWAAAGTLVGGTSSLLMSKYGFQKGGG